MLLLCGSCPLPLVCSPLVHASVLKPLPPRHRAGEERRLVLLCRCTPLRLTRVWDCDEHPLRVPAAHGNLGTACSPEAVCPHPPVWLTPGCTPPTCRAPSASCRHPTTSPAPFQLLPAPPCFSSPVQPCHNCMKDAGVQPADIQEVLMVGGMSRMPKVRSVACSLCCSRVRCGMSPHLLVPMVVGSTSRMRRG